MRVATSGKSGNKECATYMYVSYQAFSTTPHGKNIYIIYMSNCI